MSVPHFGQNITRTKHHIPLHLLSQSKQPLFIMITVPVPLNANQPGTLPLLPCGGWHRSSITLPWQLGVWILWETWLSEKMYVWTSVKPWARQGCLRNLRIWETYQKRNYFSVLFFYVWLKGRMSWQGWMSHPKACIWLGALLRDDIPN